jgi:hypothetical protein
MDEPTKLGALKWASFFGKLDEKKPMALLYKIAKEKKMITIQSKYLVEAYRKFNKRRPLSSATNKQVEVIEVEPFPCLFQHMDDIRAEIEALNDEFAKLDFKALEYTAAQFTDRWKEAREEDTSGGFVSYNNIWTIFKPGDLVLRKDAMGNDWLLVLVDVKEYLDAKNNGVPFEYTELRRGI